MTSVLNKKTNWTLIFIVFISIIGVLQAYLVQFYFHETKNIISGEGGMLVINDAQFTERAEIIWEKGTNRSQFFRGEVDKYGWVDVGSSFLPSDFIAAFLWAQLENLEKIQTRRKEIWNCYLTELTKWAQQNSIQLPKILDGASNNAHMFYLVCSSQLERDSLITNLKLKNVNAVFHYQSLHRSPFFVDKHDGRELPSSDRYSECLVRLPFYYELEVEEVLNRFI